MTAYYNEIDPAAAQWLRNLITAGHIAPGYVDERSIEDVFPSDLRGFTQCHFFAGVGVWSHALRAAGWGDDRPVWTGSCPCQPFSAAGKGAGFDDERHLWPAFHHLIQECKPAIVLGEQVASKDTDPWIDLVHTDLEALGYAFGAIPFSAAGVGAPHIRDRLYWVADATGERRNGRQDTTGTGRRLSLEAVGIAVRVADTASPSAGEEWIQRIREQRLHAQGGCGLRDAGDSEWAAQGAGLAELPGPTNGFWRDIDWLGCRDGKWRPVEPGTFPLVAGATARVVRLRAYGNAINSKAAQSFIECVMP